jgi:hypothetical protein
MAGFLLAGPMASTTVAAASLWPAFGLDVHGALKMLLVVFGCLSLFDLVLNLLPLRHQATLTNGEAAYSDGYLLYRLAAHVWFNVPDDNHQLRTACRLFDAGNYASSAGIFRDLLARDASINLYQPTFSAYYNSQQYANALALANEYPGLAATFPDYASVNAYLCARTEQLAALYPAAVRMPGRAALDAAQQPRLRPTAKGTLRGSTAGF